LVLKLALVWTFCVKVFLIIGIYASIGVNKD